MEEADFWNGKLGYNPQRVKVEAETPKQVTHKG